MKVIKRCLILLSAFAMALAVQAQNADEIIAKHIEAIGGKQKLGGITSVKYTSTNSVMGNEGPASVTVLNGKGYRSEVEVMGSKMIQVFTEKGGWMVNPMMGSADPQPMPEEMVKAGQSQIYVIPFLDYAANGGKAEYLGQEKIGDVNAYKVKFTDKTGGDVTLYFDPANYYLIRLTKSAEMMGQKVEMVTTFTDFKKTDYGWVVPQSTEIDFGQFAVSSKVKSVEVNTPVDPAIFEMKK